MRLMLLHGFSGVHISYLGHGEIIGCECNFRLSFCCIPKNEELSVLHINIRLDMYTQYLFNS